eukprot:1449840-Rhodomonas_salina.1
MRSEVKKRRRKKERKRCFSAIRTRIVLSSALQYDVAHMSGTGVAHSASTNVAQAAGSDEAYGVLPGSFAAQPFRPKSRTRVASQT